MERKNFFTILGVISAVLLLVLVAAFPLIKNLISPKDNSSQNAARITLCDKDASDLCIVTFGAGIADDMVIIFQLPKENYPAFYVKASNKGVENTYTCEADSSSPTIIFCTGVRTPLGELLDVQAYSAEGDLLIANGTFMVSSIAMAFSSNTGFGPLGKIVTPTPTGLAISTSSTPEATPTITSTPDTAYPNP